MNRNDLGFIYLISDELSSSSVVQVQVVWAHPIKIHDFRVECIRIQTTQTSHGCNEDARVVLRPREQCGA